MDNTTHKALGIFLSLVWILIATACIALIVYLFLQGSSLFSQDSTAVQLDMFTETKDGITVITGSIESPFSCPKISLTTTTDPETQAVTLLFIGKEFSVCARNSRDRIPFTASAPVIAPEIGASFNGTPIEITSQK